MKYEDIFTVPDDSLYKEGSIDPMGTQSIWSRFGQEIFHNRLNTISTDIRNYTINLFHHFVLRRLFTEYPDTVTKAKGKFKNYQSEYDIKAGLLLFLEDILTGTLVYQSKVRGDIRVNTMGILGIYKAENALYDTNNAFQLKADKTNGGLLVRQITLGVSGRYKGTFINMGFFSSNFAYEENKWLPIDSLIKNWKQGYELSVKLLSIVNQLITDGKGDYPSQSFTAFKDNSELSELYIECFGSHVKEQAIRNFWEANLGLDTGATKALYTQISKLNNNPPKEIYLNALKSDIEKDEQLKLQHIIDLEPFLSSCTQIFYLLTQKRVKNIQDIAEEVLKLLPISTENITSLPFYSGRVKMLVESIEKGEGEPLKTMYQIVDYHKNVMENKGAVPWVRIVGNGTLERLIYQNPSFSTDFFIERRPWYNNYYISTLTAIYNGLNP